MRKHRQHGFSLIELLIVVVIILVIAAIAVPNLLRSKMSANEASAIASVRTIITSELVYSATYTVGFSADLTALADGGAPANCIPPTLPVAGSACLVDPSLGSGTKGGYVFTYTAGAGVIVNSFSLQADPVAVGFSGQRHFFADNSNVIRANAMAPASQGDPPI